MRPLFRRLITVLLILGTGPGVSFITAATSTWTGPGSDFNTATNWDNGVPTDIAAFGSGTPTSVNITQAIFISNSLNGIVFNSGADAYTLTIAAPYVGGVSGFSLGGAGFVNNSGKTQTIVNLSGNGNSLSGSATLADVTLINKSELYMRDSSTAGSAVITNNAGATLGFYDTSSAGNATITNTGNLSFDFLSQADNAAIINNGPGIVGAVWRGATRTIATRSLAGSGLFYLGGMTWVTGSDNTDTTISGVISGGAQTWNGSWSDFAADSALVKVGTGTLTLSGVSTYAGGTTIYGGTLKGNTLGLQGNILNETSLVFDQGSNGTFNGVISGTGTVTKMGSGAVIFSGANTYTGNTAVNAGELSLRGSTPSHMTVGTDGTLSGYGTIGNLVNNGIVAPGAGGTNSLYATSYTGPGTFKIVMNGSSSPSLIVSGNANLTGETFAVGSANTPGQYDVLSAGSITGSFVSTPVSPYPFLTYDTQYTPTDVLFNVIRSTTTFLSCAQTQNQKQVAEALDKASVHRPEIFSKILTALDGLTASQVQTAYTQMSGDTLASFRLAGLGSSDHFVRQMNDRVNPAASIMQAETKPTEPIQLAYAGDITGMNLIPATANSEQGLWTRGVGIFDHTKANSEMGSPSSDANTAGFQTGYDFKVGEEGLLGFSGGYSVTDLSVSDRSSSGRSDAIQVGTYGRYMHNQWIVDGSLAYSGAKNSNSRTIQFPGVNETADANFHSDVYTVFVEGGYEFHPRPTFSLIPLVSLRGSHLRQNGYTETGAPGLDLAVGDHSSNSLVSSMGMELSRVFRKTTSHPVELGIHAAWQHELADVDNMVSAEFADAPGASFIVQSSPESRESAAMGFDGRVVLYKNLQSFVDYTATVRSGQNIQSILAGLSVRW